MVLEGGLLRGYHGFHTDSTDGFLGDCMPKASLWEIHAD
jgi:hypothetical protein